jgi:hypothetical protein
MTPAQCRAGRSLLDITQTELARAAELGLSTVVDSRENGVKYLKRLSRQFEMLWSPPAWSSSMRMAAGQEFVFASALRESPTSDYVDQGRGFRRPRGPQITNPDSRGEVKMRRAPASGPTRGRLCALSPADLTRTRMQFRMRCGFPALALSRKIEEHVRVNSSLSTPVLPWLRQTDGISFAPRRIQTQQHCHAGGQFSGVHAMMWR